MMISIYLSIYSLSIYQCRLWFSDFKLGNSCFWRWRIHVQSKIEGTYYTYFLNICLCCTSDCTYWKNIDAAVDDGVDGDNDDEGHDDDDKDDDKDDDDDDD